jgi:hypothetical protein
MKSLKDLDDQIPTTKINEISPFLRKYIPLLIKYLTSEEMIQERNNDYNIFLDIIEAYIPNFANRFPFLLQKLIDDPNDTKMLDFFLDKLEEQSNKSVDEKTQEVVNYMGDCRKKP